MLKYIVPVAVKLEMKEIKRKMALEQSRRVGGSTKEGGFISSFPSMSRESRMSGMYSRDSRMSVGENQETDAPPIDGQERSLHVSTSIRA